MRTAPTQLIPPEACRIYESLFDDVTRLPGWAVLIDRTAVALARATRTKRQVLVLVLDGVRAHRGARFDLQRSVSALRSLLRSDDTIARVDERTIIVVCNDIAADTDAAQVARRLVAHAELECGIGIALSGGHDDPRSFLTEAVRDARGPRIGAV
jgi:GGDEF domain-containing protein